MAVKRGLNMAKGLESLIPQGNPSARKKEESQTDQPGTQTKQEKKPAAGSKTVKKSASVAKSKKKTTASVVTDGKEAKAEKSAARTQSAEVGPEKNVPVELRISQIVPNQNQPRTEFDETALEELAQSQL